MNVFYKILQIIGVTQKFGESVDTPTFPFLLNFNELLFGLALEIYQPNLKSVALTVPEMIALSKKIGQSLDTPTFHFLQNF